MCTSAGTLQNNHENNSVEQKHSKREHHILLRIKMTTHLWDSNNKELHCQDNVTGVSFTSNSVVFNYTVLL